MFKNRSAIDIVIIVMSMMVTGVVLLTVIGVCLIRFYHPETDVKGAAQIIGNVVTTIVGALVGFIGGRAQGKMEVRNGDSK